MGKARVNRLGLGMALCFALLGRLAFATESGPDGVTFFERKVRPVFAEHCFSCHGEEKHKGGLRLDSPAVIQAGGESGPLFTPGQTNGSRLLLAVSHQDAELKMPPKQPLSRAIVADLTEWVRRGAPLPANEEGAAGKTVKKKEFQITAQDRAHWAFQPVKRPAIPGGGHPVDAFVRAGLKTKGLGANPPATPRELIRRAYFGLIGLPPTPEQLAAWEKAGPQDGYERLIDHLLALPQYGERWGRHWLDVARFAQSNGYERDGEMPLSWRYRDYVIRAFNEDKPYDRFVREQIAGDELDDATAESVVATGFQRLGVFNDEPDDKLQAEFDALDDVLSTTGAAFLGLTVGCARCHDHKFDPISQTDYYSLLAFFRGTRPYESLPPGVDSPGFLPLAAPHESGRWLAERRRKLEPLTARLAATKDANEKERIEKEIKAVNEQQPYAWTLAVRERGPVVPVTHVLVRGNASTPGAEVMPGFPQILSREKPVLEPPATNASSSGRRRVFADWVASPSNPLTARVMVNRVWQHHFGQALARTTTDFGRAGVPPTHPELLDWLAAEFMSSGWSVKKLHKLIMLSETYRQSSRADNLPAVAADPGNQLLWRQNLRRLEAESIRDTVLSITGSLNPGMTGRGFFPHLGGEVLAGQSRPGLDWEVSSEGEKSRRSVYAFVRRTMAVPLLEGLDYSNTTSPLAERATTTVAPQALMLLNDDFMHEQAARFARRLEREAGSDSTRQIRRAYQLAMNREPSTREVEIAQGLLQRQTAALGSISQRLTFRLDVASALSTDYFDRLSPAGFYAGPHTGWSYYRGFWASAYEGIRVVDRQRTPFALWEGTRFQDGVLTVTVLPSSSTEFAGFLLRTKAEGDVATGYEVVLDWRRQRVVVNRLASGPVTLAESEADLPAGKPVSLRLEIAGSRLGVFLRDEKRPVLEVVDNQPLLRPGLTGLRAWGGALSLDGLAARSGTEVAGEWVKATIEGPATRERALQALCLVILNLNEVVYVD